MGSAHRDFLKQGRNAEAKALECIVAGKSWCGERLSNEIRDASDVGLCLRCGVTLEPPHHRYYTCIKNKDIEHNDVSKTHHLAQAASNHSGMHDCKWYRAILPGHLTGPPTEWVDEALCNQVEAGGNFTDILNRTQTAGGDGGGGGKDREPRTRISGSGMAVHDPLTGEFSVLFS